MIRCACIPTAADYSQSACGTLILSASRELWKSVMAVYLVTWYLNKYRANYTQARHNLIDHISR